MRRSSPIAVLLLAACGGGGGGGDGTPPVTQSAAFTATTAPIAPSADGTDLIVALRSTASPAPALLQVDVELPPQLQLAQQQRLSAIAPLSVDGDFDGERFVVLCGDSTNPSADPLPIGDLFRLRVQPSQPRQPGTYTIALRGLRAATSAGADVPLAAQTIPVTVTVQ
jgi:hypothetical protein